MSTVTWLPIWSPIQRPRFNPPPSGGGSTTLCQPISSACIMTLFMQILHPITPFHCSPHPMTPFFKHYNLKFQIFRALHAQFKNFIKFQLWRIFTQIWQNWDKWPVGWSSKNFVSRLKVDFRISTIFIPQNECFVTHHNTKLPQKRQKTANFDQIGCFFCLIFQNTPNFANWVHWVLNGNPSIDMISIMTKKYP